MQWAKWHLGRRDVDGSVSVGVERSACSFPIKNKDAPVGVLKRRISGINSCVSAELPHRAEGKHLLAPHDRKADKSPTSFLIPARIARSGQELKESTSIYCRRETEARAR